MIVESWLNERANNKTRGRVFGIYTMINLGSTTIGQMLLTLGDPTGFVFFVVGSIIYSLSLLPTAAFHRRNPHAADAGAAGPAQALEELAGCRGRRCPDRHFQRCLRHAGRGLWAAHRS